MGPENKIKTLPKVSKQLFSLLKLYPKPHSLSKMGELWTQEAPNPSKTCPKAWACAFPACLGHLAKSYAIYYLVGVDSLRKRREKSIWAKEEEEEALRRREGG